jgi:hypothetical protein
LSEALRGKLTGMVLQGERLRDYRAVEVLEHIGTPESRAVLQRSLRARRVLWSRPARRRR